MKEPNRYQRIDGFFVDEDGQHNFHIPDDFMTPAQAEAWRARLQEICNGVNQLKTT